MLVADAALLPTATAAIKDADTVSQLVVAEDAETGTTGADLADEPGLVSYSEFLARDSGASLPWSVPDELAPISINYTSGTTGLPKGVIYTHRGAYLNSFGEVIHGGHDENSVYLWTLPMFHCNGWCNPWALTAIGGTHVCLREVRGDAIWKRTPPGSAGAERAVATAWAGTDATPRSEAPESSAPCGGRLSRPPHRRGLGLSSDGPICRGVPT
jgi:fatty-acyl-CoA synthase